VRHAVEFKACFEILIPLADTAGAVPVRKCVPATRFPSLRKKFLFSWRSLCALCGERL
jgi:hypothetical protein